MWKDKINRDFLQRIIIIVLFAMLPLVYCYALCWSNGIGFSDVRLLGNSGNDEMIYYKMIEGMVDYGIPVGYFGYNESHAVVGTYSTWSPVLLIFWGIWGKVFGWSLWSPIVCNIVLLMLAMSIFAVLTRPNIVQTAVIFGMYLACQFITFFAFTTLPEVSLYFLLIIFAGISINLFKTNLYWKTKVVFAYIVVVLLAWMRPYYCILLLLPSIELVKRCGKKVYGIIASSIIFIVTCCVYVYINRNLCAPFLTPLFRFSWLTLIIESPKSGIIYLITQFLQAVRQFLASAKGGILGIDGDSACTGFFVIFIFYLIILRQAVCEKKKEIVVRYGILAMFVFLMFCAAAFVFSISAGGKHFLEFIVLGIFMIGYELNIKLSSKLLLILTWIFFVANPNVITKGPDDEVAIVEDGAAQLADAITVDPNADYWDNTIIWVDEDGGEAIWWRGLYAVPSGMGVNFCRDYYVIDNYDCLQSKYLCTNKTGVIYTLCEEKGARRIAEYGNLYVYQLR